MQTSLNPKMASSSNWRVSYGISLFLCWILWILYWLIYCTQQLATSICHLTFIRPYKHWYNPISNSSRNTEQYIPFDEPGQPSMTAKERQELKDYNMKHKSSYETLYDITPPPTEIAMEVIEQPPTKFLNIRQMYKLLPYCDLANPTIAQLVENITNKVEQLERISEWWNSDPILLEQLILFHKAEEIILKEEPLTREWASTRVREISLCTKGKALKEASLRMGKDFLLEALQLYGANPEPANGRSVQEHVKDVLSYYKGKGRPMFSGDTGVPVIDSETFGTTGDLLVWECKHYLWDLYSYDQDMELDVVQRFQRAQKYILAGGTWVPPSGESEAGLTHAHDIFQSIGTVR
jgi:hypothetical protein